MWTVLSVVLRHHLLESLPDLANVTRGAGVNLYITVDDDVDIDAFYARVRERGATVTQEIADQFWGHRHFTIVDPDGYSLSFAKNVREVSPAEIAAALSHA